MGQTRASRAAAPCFQVSALTASGDAAAVHRAMRFVDNSGKPTETYPHNPNGSPDGLTAVTTADGRFTVLMPHPERVFRNVLMSWTSGERSARSPWMRMFGNARGWVLRQ